MASAAQIHSGGPKGAYFGQFCPALQKVLKKAQFDYRCAQSRGSLENIQRVRDNPTDIGFSQFDVFALESAKSGYARPLVAVRTDVARECLFLVTNDKTLTSFGSVSGNAYKLHFIMPPRGSGSAATFDFLRHVDPEGIGLAQNVTYATSVEDAIRQTLKASDNTVTLFVQFPDPDNFRFKLVDELGGHFVPVIDRSLLRQQIGGEKVYYAEDTEVIDSKLWKKGQKLITACTPLVIFTGSPEQFPAGQARLDQEDLIRTIKAAPRDDLRPKKGFFKRLWARTKSLSAEAVEKMMVASEKAREAAAPALEKAKEAGGRAWEKAKELGQKASEAAAPALEKAKEAGGRAWEKAKELGGKAMEKAKELTE